MSWEPDTPIGFSPCGTAFGAIRRAYVAKAKFFANEGPAATNRIKWYVVPDDTPVYDDWTAFWPRVDVPADQAHPQFEAEGHGRDVRKFYAGDDIYGYDKDHFHGDRDDFLGLSEREKYFVEGEPDPIQTCNGTGVFAKFRFSHSFGPVANRSRFRFRGLVMDPPARRDCYTLCLHAGTFEHGVGPNIPIFDGASAWTLMFWYQRRVASALIEVDQWAGALHDAIGIQLYVDNTAYIHAGPAGGLGYGQAAITGDTALHHVAAVFDGSGATNADRLKFYLDGVLVPLTYPAAIPAVTSTSGAPFQLGKRAYDGSYSNGDLDDVAAFDYPMSASRIFQIAHGSKHPAQFSPSLLYEFEEGEGTIAHDTSGNGYDATLYNGAKFCGSLCLPRSAARFRFGHVINDDPNPVLIPPARFRFRGLVDHVPSPGWAVRGRFRFRADVVHVPSPGHALDGRFRFHSDVVPLVDDGGISVSKFRFHADVVSVVTPGVALEGKFRFKHEFWVRPVAGSTQCIVFNAAETQYLEWQDTIGFNTAGMTVYFWAKRPHAGHSGIFSIGGAGDPDSVCELKVIDDGGLKMIGKVSAYVDDLLVETFGGAEPEISQGWHHYAMVFREGLDPDYNTLEFYFDGVLQDSELASSPARFQFSRGDENDMVGRSVDAELTTGKMDNVGYFAGALDAETILQMATAEMDPSSLGGPVFFRWESDADPDAWNDGGSYYVTSFVGAPDHSDDVPPLLAD